LSMLFYVVLAFVACRRVRLSDAAVIGTMMIPVFFYPSNYYLHILFIWPLLLAAWSTRDGDRSWSLIAATVLGMNDGFLPPTINYEKPDPDCDLDYVSDGTRDMDVKAVLSNSFGFGGHNASIIIKAYEG